MKVFDEILQSALLLSALQSVEWFMPPVGGRCECMWGFFAGITLREQETAAARVEYE